MPLSPVDLHMAYDGMATDVPAAILPKNLCQSATGFLPGRNGRLDLAPLLKRIQQSLGITIYGTAVWLTESGGYDKLILVSASTVYSADIVSVTFSPTQNWRQDEKEDGPHSYYLLESPLSSVGTHGYDAVITKGVYSIQMQKELILSIGGGLFRYYIDSDGTGTERFYKLGLNAPIAIPSLSSSAGGSLTSSQTYSYLFTWEDELGRESSPSDPNSLTLNSTNNRITVDRTAITTPVGRGITYWNVYRLNPGATIYKFVAQVAAGTNTYVDNFADSAINANDSAPSDGENDAPLNTSDTVANPIANMFAVWKDRLVINAMTDPNLIQVSNAGSPTQFSSLPLPTNLDDGLRVEVGGHGQNQVTGLANLGSLLAVFGRETTSLLYGDDISDFTLRETLQRGCQNPNSIQRCENEVLFLSDDGVYSIGYESGYSVLKRSIPIDDLFNGFQWVKSTKEPTSKWRYEASQAMNAITTHISSFYSDNRYYLSIYNRTLAMDIRTGGWMDTGWGFIKTVTRYNSQQSVPQASTIFNTASSPETIFLTLGDPTTWATDLHYFTSVDTYNDRDSPPSATATLVMRPVGADPEQRVRLKRVKWLSQYGETNAKEGEIMGEVSWTVDGYTFDPVPIYAGITTKRKDALFEFDGPVTSGNVIYATLTFNVKKLSLESSIFELSYLN